MAEGLTLVGVQRRQLQDGRRAAGAAPAWTIAASGVPDGRASAFSDAVARGRLLGECSNLARELCNEPGNTLTPREFARRSGDIVAGNGLTFEVLDEKRIEQLGMGLLLGVARGSNEPPRLMVFRHDPPGAPPGPVLGLVGKGITFDTGGISIKPADGMERMKDDMAGGAAVVCAMRAIALLKAPIRVIGVVPTTENMPGGRAIKPGDILKSAAGKTVEVINTDAEGRLILGDGLWYARKLGATHLVDVATLTGAIVVALGKITSGLFGTPQPWVEQVRRVADRAGDRVWPMPIFDEYRDQIKSEIADLHEHRRPAGRLDHGGAVPEGVHRRPAVGAPRHRRHGVGRGGEAVPAEGTERRGGPHARRTRVHQPRMGVTALFQPPVTVRLIEPPVRPDQRAGRRPARVARPDRRAGRSSRLLRAPSSRGILFYVRSRSRSSAGLQAAVAAGCLTTAARPSRPS